MSVHINTFFGQIGIGAQLRFPEIFADNGHWRDAVVILEYEKPARTRIHIKNRKIVSRDDLTSCILQTLASADTNTDILMSRQDRERSRLITNVFVIGVR